MARPFDAPPAGARPMDGGTHTVLFDAGVPMNSRAARPMHSTIPWVDDPRCADCVADHRDRPAPKVKDLDVCIGHSRARQKRARLEAQKIMAEQARVDAVRPPAPSSASEVFGGPRIEDVRLEDSVLPPGE